MTLAWIALKSPGQPSWTDLQSLESMNRSASALTSIYRVLEENLSQLEAAIEDEKTRLETDRELLRNQKSQLRLQKWTAQRQFVKDCIEYQKVRHSPIFEV